MSLKVEESSIPVGMITIPCDALPFVAGMSPAMRALERVIAEVAPTNVPILLVGESGTGKEVVALEVHRRSRNSHEPFVKCHCTALVGESLRAQLGNGTKNGRELTGTGGTTFFDDINRLDTANQNVLLQFLSDNGSVPQSHCF